MFSIFRSAAGGAVSTSRAFQAINVSRAASVSWLCSDREPSIVLVRLGIPEVREHSVSEVLRYEPRAAGDRIRAAGVVGPHEVAHILGIELAREPGRADEIREEHGQVPALLVRELPAGGGTRERRAALAAEIVARRAPCSAAETRDR